MNKGRASQTRPNFWIKNSLFQKHPMQYHRRGMNHPIGGVWAMQARSTHRPSSYHHSNANRKKIWILRHIHACTRAREVGIFQLKSISLLRFVSWELLKRPPYPRANMKIIKSRQDYGKEFILILVAFLAIKRPQEESTINSTLHLWKCWELLKPPPCFARIEA